MAVHFLHRIGEIIAIFVNGKTCKLAGAVHNSQVGRSP